VGFVVGGLATFLAIPIFGRLRALNEPVDRITAVAPELGASAVPPTAETPAISPIGSPSSSTP
jgi:hypothetical protein